MREERGAVKPRVIIENVVASARVNQRIDLGAMEKPRSRLLIFENGNIICVGTKSEVDAEKAVMKCVGELRKAGLLSSGSLEVEIRNIVASVSLEDAVVDVESLAAIEVAGVEVMHEPEQFPGAICHMDEQKVVFLAFSTGKLVCTGAKREIDVYRAVEKFIRILDENGALINRLFRS